MWNIVQEFVPPLSRVQSSNESNICILTVYGLNMP